MTYEKRWDEMRRAEMRWVEHRWDEMRWSVERGVWSVSAKCEVRSVEFQVRPLEQCITVAPPRLVRVLLFFKNTLLKKQCIYWFVLPMMIKHQMSQKVASFSGEGAMPNTFCSLQHPQRNVHIVPPGSGNKTASARRIVTILRGKCTGLDETEDAAFQVSVTSRQPCSTCGILGPVGLQRRPTHKPARGDQ